MAIPLLICVSLQGHNPGLDSTARGIHLPGQAALIKVTEVDGENKMMLMGSRSQPHTHGFCILSLFAYLHGEFNTVVMLGERGITPRSEMISLTCYKD